MAQGARKLAEGVQTIIRTLVEGPTQIPHGKSGADRGSVWMLGGRYDVGNLSVSTGCRVWSLGCRFSEADIVYLGSRMESRFCF